MSSLWDQIYPVGSIYITANATNPSVLFGGTWEQLKGKFLVGVDSSDTDFKIVEKTGGEKTHILTVDEIPPHDHIFYYNTNSEGQASGKSVAARSSASNVIQQNGDYTFYSWTQESGGGQAHNNLPPYMTVYMWKRIS